MKIRLRYLFTLFLFSSFLINAQPGVYISQHHGPTQDVIDIGNGQAWVVTDSEVLLYDNGTITTSFLVNSISNTPTVGKVIRRDSGILYVAMDNGIYKYDLGNWSLVGPPSFFTDISHMEFTANHTLWCIGNNGNVYEYDGTSFIDHNQTGITMVTYQNDVYVGKYWSSPVEIYSNGNWQAISLNTVSADPGSAFISHMAIDDNGTLWCSTRGGITRFENQAWVDVILVRKLVGSKIAIDGLLVYVENNPNSISRINTNDEIDTLFAPTYGTNDGDLIFSPNNTNEIFKLGLNGSLLFGKETGVFKYFPSLAEQPSYKQLSVNKLTAGVAPSGDLFRDFNKPDIFNMLTVDGKRTIFASNVWINASHGSDTLLALTTYKSEDGGDFYSGPISNTYDSLYVSKYNHVWKVTAAEIKYHLNNFRKANYTPIDVILNWPGNGMQARGEAKFLAPFMDYNSNGIYEPYKGEHPDIRGDEALFFIFNDARGPKTKTRGASMGIEIQGMMYAFDSISAPELHNSVFLSYKLYNRSSFDYQKLKFGFWTDFSLGNSSDDRVGCDSLSGLYYSYNGDADDEGPYGFGLNPPAMGGLFLSDTLSGFMSYYHSSSGGINVNTTTPSNYKDHHNYLNQKWKDGSSLRLENPSGFGNYNNGDGYNPNSSDPNSKFAYNDAAGWFDTRSERKRTIPVVELGTLAAGENRCIDLALIYARDSSNTPLLAYNSVIKLKEYADSLKQFYSNEGYKCMGESIGIEEEIASQKRAEFYPNPIERGGVLSIKHNNEVEEIKLVDAQGKLLLSQKKEGKKEFAFSIPMHISKGLYFVILQETSKKVSTLKLSVK